MENCKKEIGNNKCQTCVKSLKINNPREIPSTFNVCLSTVADTVIGNIKMIIMILEIT